MDQRIFDRLVELKEECRSHIEGWTKDHPGLMASQQGLAEAGGYDYRVETPIVFNSAWDKVEAHDNIRIVLVADNPGLNEQRAEKRAYLVGQSGRLAEGLFRRELSIDFRKDVLILNKSPIHTPKTKELTGLLPTYQELLTESQVYMASLCARAASLLGAQLWITGYSEFGPRGIFRPFALALPEQTRAAALDPERVLVFRHFSMNQFSGDLKRKRLPGEGAMDALRRIGAEYRKEKLGI